MDFLTHCKGPIYIFSPKGLVSSDSRLSPLKNAKNETPTGQARRKKSDVGVKCPSFHVANVSSEVHLLPSR